jgi:hypothetical protein
MSHRVRVHRHINRAIRQHLNELNYVRQVEDDAETLLIVKGNEQDCVPLAQECMNVQNDLIHSEMESVMEEVHETEDHDKHHDFCISIAQSDPLELMSVIADDDSFGVYLQMTEAFTENLHCLGSVTEQKSEYDSMGTDLATWSVKHGIKHTALNALLSILRQHHHTLPKDARTLLKTAQSTEVHPMKDQSGAEGEYLYFGVEHGLRIIFQCGCPLWLGKQNTLNLLFNIDGLPFLTVH